MESRRVYKIGTTGRPESPEMSETDQIVDDSRDSIEECGRMIDKHFKMVELEIVSAFEAELQRADDTRQKTAALIEEETQREVEKLYRRQDERLLKNNSDCETTRRKIGQRKGELVGELMLLASKMRGFVNKMKVKREASTPSVKVHANLDKLLSASVPPSNGEAKCEPHKACPISCVLKDIAGQVSGIASGVSFTREDGEAVGRIEGAVDRWVLEDTIGMAPVEVPILKGSVNEDEVVVEDKKTSAIYVTNIKDKKTREVLNDKTPLFNCASWDGSIIVCGTGTGNVRVYDRLWRRIRNVTLPVKSPSIGGPSSMCVAVDEDGNILVAKYGGNQIFVFNPAGSSYIMTLEIDEMVPIHGIHVLPSGIAVLSAMYGEQVCLLDKTGKTKSTIFLEESEHKCMSSLAADHWADALYNLSCDSATGLCRVEELCNLATGACRPEKLLEFPAPRIANGLISAERMTMLTPESMVVCDGSQLLVYRKQRGVQHLNGIAV